MSFTYIPTEGNFNESAKSIYQKNRSRINVNLFPTRQNIPKRDQYCRVCNVKYIVENHGKILFCKSCGERKDVDTKSDLKKRLVGRYGNRANLSQGPLIVTKKDPRKKKTGIEQIDDVNSRLTEEDKSDLRNMGFRI